MVRKAEHKTSELGQELILAAKDMLAHARGEKKFPTYSYNAPANIDVKEVRSSLHLTQEEFASFIGASVHAVRHWENGRRTPDGTARTLLCVLKANPSAVLAALNNV